MVRVTDLPAPIAPRVVRRYSSVLPADSLAREYEDDPNPGDLSSEIALARAILADYLAMNGTAKHFSAMRLVECVSRIVESQAKIENAAALPLAKVIGLMRAMASALEHAAALTVHDPIERAALLREVQRAWAALTV